MRVVGRQLGLPSSLVDRQPFPGPGLAVRCLGEVRKERLETLREADAIVIDELTKAGLYREIRQAFAVLLPVQSVGVMGDDRTYDDARFSTWEALVQPRGGGGESHLVVDIDSPGVAAQLAAARDVDVLVLRQVQKQCSSKCPLRVPKRLVFTYESWSDLTKL